jgi:hypothetical protein
MSEVVIDKKKYVVIPLKEYTALQKRAASKYKPEKEWTIAEARQQTKKLIRKWAAAR